MCMCEVETCVFLLPSDEAQSLCKQVLNFSGIAIRKFTRRALGIDDNATLHDVPTSEVSSHELSAEDPREFEFAAAVINECNNAAVSACSSVLLATDSTSHQRSLVSQSEGLQVNNACCSVGSMGSRKQCAVHGCPELIAPTMWRHHMSLHAKGLLPGSVPWNATREQALSM